ncbi:hypothetical protein ACLI4Z_18015 [Natrialbaceae archaeon A-arb3/5]
MVNVVSIAEHVVRISASSDSTELVNIDCIIVAASSTADVLVALRSLQNGQWFDFRLTDEGRISFYTSAVSQQRFSGVFY